MELKFQNLPKYTVNVKFERINKKYFNIYVNGKYIGELSCLNKVIIEILRTKYKEFESCTLFTDCAAYPCGRIQYKGYYYNLDVKTEISELIDNGGIEKLNNYIKEELTKIIKWKENIDKKCIKFSLTFTI